MRLTALERAFLAFLLRPGCVRVGCREVARAFYGGEAQQHLNNARAARNRLIELGVCRRAGTRGNKCKLAEGMGERARLWAAEMQDGAVVR